MSDNRKDLYDKAIENSAVSWCNLYLEEKAKREAIEERYKLLVKEIKHQGKQRVADDHDKFLFNYAKGWDRL